jgi:hypothetical protein
VAQETKVQDSHGSAKIASVDGPAIDQRASGNAALARRAARPA